MRTGAATGAKQTQNTNESHMCLVLAWRQVVLGPTAFFRSRGQHPLIELLNCRHACEDSLSDAHRVRKRVQSPTSTFLRTGCHKLYFHCEALHASMHPMTASKANSNIMSSSAPVWIDCDAGSDDALGILLAARANVVGISSVRGNTAAEQVSKNVLRTLTLCSRQEVPVFTGADKSLNGQQQPVPKWSGQDGLSDQPDVFPSSASITAQPASGNASQKLVEAAQSHASSLTVIATGPLTNIAHALQLDPQLVSKVQHLVIMGGNEEYNQSTSTGAEFNFYCDPEAADMVIRKFSGRVTLLTWECMQNNALPGSVATQVATKDSQKARFVAAICGLDGIAKKKEQDWVPCDPLALAVAMNNSIISATDSVQCIVETQVVDQRGQTSFADCNKDASWSESQCGLVSKVSKVDTTQYAEVIENCMNHEQESPI